jgi:cell division protein FtsA
MSKSKYGIISILDIGTTKIVCFIVRMDLAGNSQIIGIGHQVSQGFRAGTITDIKLAENSILSAIEAAEQMAEENIEKIIINISSNKLTSHHLVTHATLGPTPITERDIGRIITQSLEQFSQPDLEIIHSIPLDYAIDSTDGIKDPVGMVGSQLTGKLHVITAPATSVVNLANCLARCQLTIADLIISPYAAGLACLTEDEMELGCTVIDMGGGTTSFALFKSGNMLYADSISVGGRHVTSDIARGLSTDMVNAERIKTLYGNAICTSADHKEMINVPYIGEEDEMGMHHIPRALLSDIISPRIEETLEMVKERLELSGFEGLMGQNIVITGGASQLMGLKEIAGRILGKHVRIGYPKPFEGLAESTKGAAFSTAIGMVHFAASNVRQAQYDIQEQGEKKGRLAKIMEWLSQNF